MARGHRIARVARKQSSEKVVTFKTVRLRLFLFDCAQLVQELGEDTTDAPHVDRLPVLLVKDADLWSSVPA
jgi:hypothetical protein